MEIILNLALLKQHRLQDAKVEFGMINNFGKGNKLFISQKALASCNSYFFIYTQTVFTYICPIFSKHSYERDCLFALLGDRPKFY